MHILVAFSFRVLHVGQTHGGVEYGLKLLCSLCIYLPSPRIACMGHYPKYMGFWGETRGFLNGR